VPFLPIPFSHPHLASLFFLSLFFFFYRVTKIASAYQWFCSNRMEAADVLFEMWLVHQVGA